MKTLKRNIFDIKNLRSLWIKKQTDAVLPYTVGFCLVFLGKQNPPRRTAGRTVEMRYAIRGKIGVGVWGVGCRGVGVE